MNLNLVVCITFFFKSDRIKYLKEVIESILEINVNKEIYIVTNTFETSEIEMLNSISNQGINIKSYENGHPYLLAWSHYLIFQEKIKNDKYTHFLYLEDDIKFNKINFIYWLNYREKLKEFNVYPSFLRFEINKHSIYCSTDILKKISIYDCDLIQTLNNETFINIPYSYQAMYLYDRELMLEFFKSNSFNPDFDHGIYKSIFPMKPFNIREKAALGLTYYNVPSNFRSRTFLPFDKKINQIKSDCLIHHIPNNYALDEASSNGKIDLYKIFKKKSILLFMSFQIKKNIKKIIKSISNL